jgi:hypothetical protein
VPCWVEKLCTANGIVQFSCERSSVVAIAYSFQVATKSSTNSAASAGFASGRMICQKIRKVLAPSMRADSSSSSGTLRKKPYSTKIWYGIPKARYGSSRPSRESSSPTLIMVENSGPSPIWIGIIEPIATTISRIRAPRKRIRASAKAAAAAIPSPSGTLIRLISVLFPAVTHRLPTSIASA